MSEAQQEENELVIEQEQVGYQNGHPVMEGERYGCSPITLDWYRVTKWEDHGDGDIVAISKEKVDDSEVPQ